MKFYGRDQEIAALTNELRLAETSSRLAVITGRRRVGKTRLILKVAEESGRPMLYFLCRRRYAEAELAQITSLDGTPLDMKEERNDIE